jgi:transposase InsO family protein
LVNREARAYCLLQRKIAAIDWAEKFSSLADAKDKIAAWLRDYNESRPHRALNNLAPLEYLAQLENGA